MGWDRFDRRRNNKESVVAAYLSDEGSAPMPRLQGHTRLEEDLLITMSVRSRQSSPDTRDEGFSGEEAEPSPGHDNSDPTACGATALGTRQSFALWLLKPQVQTLFANRP